LARLDESIAAFNQRFILNLWNQGTNMAASDSKLNANSEAEKVIIHEIPLSEHAKSLEYRLWCISND
jgi:hypothetical protein